MPPQNGQVTARLVLAVNKKNEMISRFRVYPGFARDRQLLRYAVLLHNEEIKRTPDSAVERSYGMV